MGADGYIQLLHIHPLTLEDILQQDPREKLELFSKLGYYFISFRAIESRATKEKIQREATLENLFGTTKPILDDDGPIGAANVYLAVFKDGVCCVCKRFPTPFFKLTSSLSSSTSLIFLVCYSFTECIILFTLLQNMQIGSGTEWFCWRKW